MKTLMLTLALFALPLSPRNAPAQNTAQPAATPPAAAKPAAATPGVLAPGAVQQLMPPAVFFSGQTAATQLRNSGGMRFPDGKLVLAGMVDTGGYSSALREAYQLYLISEVPVEIGGMRVPAGAYGCGFVSGSFVVMDIGGAELARAPTSHDAGMQRPRPLQVLAGANSNELRLFSGRDYITLRRAK